MRKSIFPRVKKKKSRLTRKRKSVRTRRVTRRGTRGVRGKPEAEALRAAQTLHAMRARLHSACTMLGPCEPYSPRVDPTAPFGPYTVHVDPTRSIWTRHGPFGPYPFVDPKRWTPAYSVRVNRPRCSAHVPLIFESEGVPGRLCGLASPGPAGYVLGPFGPNSVRVDPTRSIWTLHGPFAPYTVHVDPKRSMWTLHGPFAPYTVHVDPTRSMWTLNGPCGP
jgi:hypothetical protein